MAPVRSGAFNSSCLRLPGVPLLLQRGLGGGRRSDGRLEFRDALAQPGRVLDTSCLYAVFQASRSASIEAFSDRSPQLVELPEVRPRRFIRRVRRPAASRPQPIHLGCQRRAAPLPGVSFTFELRLHGVARRKKLVAFARHSPSSAACFASACFLREEPCSLAATSSAFRACEATSASCFRFHGCISSRNAFSESLAFSTTCTLDFRSWQARFHRSASTWRTSTSRVNEFLYRRSGASTAPRPSEGLDIARRALDRGGRPGPPPRQQRDFRVAPALLFAAARGVLPRADGALDLLHSTSIDLGDALGAFRFARFNDTLTYARQLLPVRLVRPHEQLDAPGAFRLGRPADQCYRTGALRDHINARGALLFIIPRVPRLYFGILGRPGEGDGGPAVRQSCSAAASILNAAARPLSYFVPPRRAQPPQ